MGCEGGWQGFCVPSVVIRRFFLFISAEAGGRKALEHLQGFLAHGEQLLQHYDPVPASQLLLSAEDEQLKAELLKLEASSARTNYPGKQLRSKQGFGSVFGEVKMR